MGSDGPEKTNHVDETEMTDVKLRDDKAKTEQPRPISIDMEDRDPTNMNDHLGLVFEDIIAEPEPGTHSYDKVWINSYRVFALTKLWTYRVLSLIFGIPLAIYWGLTFAFISFCHIWCLQPSMKAWKVNMSFSEKVIAIITSTFIRPFVDVVARLFGRIHVTHAKGKPKDSLEDVHVA